MHDRIQFILKKRESNWGPYALSSGLFNSCTFLVDLLTSCGIIAELVEVIDNNDIDAVVTAFKPTHAIIEAYWVVPTKFPVLQKLHPLVRWIVRNHSKTPFLASEGITMQWTAAYLAQGIEVMCNSIEGQSDLQDAATAWGLSDRLVTYGPNYYPLGTLTLSSAPVSGRFVDVGCFGAIRPFKNQLAQAIAAATFAKLLGKQLRFHINSSRVELGGDPILKSLIAFFDSCPGAQLVQHSWVGHAVFLKLIGTMNVVMQVSFSETFNIVAADAASQSVPVVVSPEIPWLGSYAQADPTSVATIIDALRLVWDNPLGPRIAQQWRDLMTYSRETETVWLSRFSA